MRARRLAAALNADRSELRDRLGDGEHGWHRIEGLAAVVLIEPRDHHAHAAVGKSPSHWNEERAEELRLVDADDLRVWIYGSL